MILTNITSKTIRNKNFGSKPKDFISDEADLRKAKILNIPLGMYLSVEKIIPNKLASIAGCKNVMKPLQNP